MALRLYFEPLCYDYNADCPISASREYQMLVLPSISKILSFQATGLLSRIIRNSALSGHPLWTVKSGFITGYWLWFHLYFHLHFLCGTYSLRWVKFYHAIVLCPINVCAFLRGGGSVYVFMCAGVCLCVHVYHGGYGTTSGVILPQASLPLFFETLSR